MSTDVQTTDRLTTIDALVQLATFKHLPGPSVVRMLPGILVITLASHADAIAWCEALAAAWNESAGEIWNTHNTKWRGWTLQIHSYTEKS
jgi:hypothetical protein